MSTVTVDLADRPYDIRIKAGLLQDIAQQVSSYARSGRFLVVTDTNVAREVWPDVHASLTRANLAAELFTLPAGEDGKSWEQLEKLTDWLLENHIERSDHILALGGGVVGDITGFAAHIIKRGCSFIQIPTTLLAQVDSSVGGKTAINSKAGKNLVGAFHQPSLVLIDPDVLESLPRRQLAAGFAEVVKYGLIDDPDFFDWCDSNLDAFFAGDAEARRYAIQHSVTSKARIVAADEKELTGTRALLNLGHTFGHALEADTGFSDRLFHGEAVATGMALAFRYSVRLGLCRQDDADRAADVLHRAGLPVTLADAGVTANGTTLVDYMLHDKKMSGGKLPFLLARGIGRTFLSKDVDLADVAAFLDNQA
ncbi:3-dehydroquinate synthase [Sphingorhabdus contaminans]|uniref:3-dehydroquinate synthase n=1 Tax=Sphingorhabdus contaminans TaxID=1343899 RepID=A0A553WHD3_9SPHN|nr:3-dehydroquinate synthase [Sphingorhabdus contaminans]TSB04100.1 3-dehydroquinate synthase [Sphingorhabdus contaminans]